MLPSEALAKVNALHFRIVAESFRRARAEDLSIVDNVRSIGNRKRLAHIVIRDQNSDPARFRSPIMRCSSST